VAKFDSSAGNLVRHLLKRTTKSKVDPRKDLLIDIGLLLNEDIPFVVDGVILDKLESNDPVFTLFTVHVQGEVVFDAIVSATGIEIGTYDPGPWVVSLCGAARMARR
jgi:hypothetical protein